ncbi:MAG: hypothetical protein U9N44_02275 [Chloroflexota bacterium]|nr:hypothetical protein [Chloroflexota bacterium]
MLESMLDAVTRKKIMCTLMGVGFAGLSFVGLIFIAITCVNPLFHPHFWPMLIFQMCAGAWLMVGTKRARINLAYIALLSSLWILLNSILGFVSPPAEGLAELTAGMMRGLSGTGSLIAVFGALLGIMGVMKYIDEPGASC